MDSMQSSLHYAPTSPSILCWVFSLSIALGSSIQTYCEMWDRPLLCPANLLAALTLGLDVRYLVLPFRVSMIPNGGEEVLVEQ